MCCAQTAAPEGKECKAPGNEKNVVPPLNARIWFQSARRSKTHAKICSRSLPKPSPASPQTFQNPGSGNPWEEKCIQEAAQASQEAAKSAQQLPKRHPRSVQERPRAGPELPKGGEVASKSDPREVRSLPKPSPTSPKTRMEQDFCGKLCSTRSGSDFISFFHLRDKLAICKNLGKLKKNCSFYESGATSH